MDPEDETMEANPNRRVKLDDDDSPTKTLRITSFGRRADDSRPASPSNDSTIPPTTANAIRRTLSFDIRSIPNPPKHIRSSQSGLHKPLQEWLFSEAEVVEKVDGIVEGIEQTLAKVDSSQATDVLVEVGINCELGRHRSVAVVEKLGKRKWPQGWEVEVIHRDVHRQRAVDKGRTKARKGQRKGRSRAEDSD
ncbi:hypothetical protein FA13DRAFT_1742668 [Coprinellus micaceus]|uniref:RapZ C-terminal domain-containing protein n=1 Tax=Coprinellus micaceus TaxID=71717 RepID=A0A4Y7SFT9_COPMI|nr:hypothetical protein FA13DRAFT_1742668 [Coprinellus micaceus]